MSKAITLLSVGSPIVDSLAPVTEDFLRQYVSGEKGGMALISSTEMAALLARLPAAPTRALGGAAMNTGRAVAHLGAPTAALGKVGDDAAAQFYVNGMTAAGVSPARFKHAANCPNARCLSLITPDAARTMRTDLGAAGTLTAEELSLADFADVQCVYVEGYLLFNTTLAERIFALATEAGCEIALNLGSFEVVRALLQPLRAWLKKYVTMVFANLEEARELLTAPTLDAASAAQQLTAYCALAVVTAGANGAEVATGGAAALHAAALPPTALVDTTGAGDFWAAGFLFAKTRGADLASAAALGAHLAQAIIAETGVELPAPTWAKLRALATGK